MDGAPVKNAYVYLIWQDPGPYHGEFNSTSGTNKVGNGLNGEYTFWIPPHKKDATTPDTAPQNITVAAQWYSHFWGYTKVTMKQNNPPNKPITPSGQTNGKIKVEYTYTSITTNPDGDPIFYNWIWGDGTTSGWLGPYNSGVTSEASHNWSKKGNYAVKVKTKDIHGNESIWSDPLPIKMPYSLNKPLLQFLELLFQRFPNVFPVLRQFLGY
jgi:PKD domain